MLLLDLSHTSHTQALTGVQRVCRSLYFALREQQPVTAVSHDPYLAAWRSLKTWEVAQLENPAPVQTRGARWPLAARLSGHYQRLLGRTAPLPPAASGLIVPEIFSPTTAAALPALFSAVKGPRVAVFHDAIALKLPEHTPAKTVARFPAYLQELLAFDGIAAVSEDSRQCLIDYWRWLEISSPPPVTTIPLAQPAKVPASNTSAKATTPVVLSVGSLEGRKNHTALLDACEQLWARGLIFELHLIGLVHPQTGRAALEKLNSLKASGRSIRFDGPVGDESLHAAYARCTFTVYPSLMEGFGLPVLESLAHGKPCICTSQGALGEAAAGGGCLTVENPDVANLAAAIERLLKDDALRSQLAATGSARPKRSWADYTRDLTNWMQNLPRRSASAISTS